jgi:POT family proton-dependent oligopeptide transporter
MAKYTPLTAPDPATTGWPSGIPYIIGNEGCERFSYYGMKALLAVYITGLYVNLRGFAEKAAEDAATEATHLFSAAVYLLPLLGALLADRLLGKYRTILWLSVVYCVGHVALALFEDPRHQIELFGEVLVDPLMGLYIGLGLIAVGSGGIKPCVSAHVGDQFGKANWHLLQKVFNAFYFMINLGSALATLIIPAIQGDLCRVGADGECLARGAAGVVGYTYSGSVGWAFGIPGILMGLATIIFWMGRKSFVHVPAHPGGRLGLLDFGSGLALVVAIFAPFFMYFAHIELSWLTVVISGVALAVFAVLFQIRQRLSPDDGFLAIMFHAVASKLRGGRGSFFAEARGRFGDKAVEGPIAVLKVASVLAVLSVFWGLFHQHSTTWTHQAKAMDRVFALSLGGWLIVGAVLGLSIGAAVGLSVAKGARARWLWVAGGLAAGAVLGGVVAGALGRFEINERQFAAANPFMVMIFIPLTLHGVYPLMKRLGFEPTPLRRMTAGMVLAALSFVPIALIQGALDAGVNVHVSWQLVAFVIVTFAEVMVSVTGLEFAYSQAPKRMKSVVMSLWLVNVTLGDLLVVGLTRLEMSRVDFFWLFAALMAGAAVLFGWRAWGYRYRDFTQND